MQKVILTASQVRELVSANRYRINSKTRFMSRCIDGRYGGKPQVDETLPALAIAGADAGELALMFSAANSFGYSLDEKKAYKSLIEVIGGEKNLRFHTDDHAEKTQLMGGCGHMTKIRELSDQYNLTKDQLDFITTKLHDAKKKGAQEVVLQGPHLEGAVLLVRGNWAIYPAYEFQTGDGAFLSQVFIFHQSLVDERHRALVQALIKNKAVEFSSQEYEDYLYTTLSETAEIHLYETAKHLAKGLPIYLVQFEEDGDFKLEDAGVV